jgi:hypothetical protein
MFLAARDEGRREGGEDLRQRMRWKAIANSVAESMLSLSTSLMAQMLLTTPGGIPLFSKIGMRICCERTLRRLRD